MEGFNIKNLLLLFILVFGLAACQQDETLSPPMNVRYQDETVVWDEVEGAMAYTVLIDDVTHTVSEPQFDLHDYPNGDYEVRVRANTDTAQSIYSSTVSFTIDRPFDHPTSVVIEDETLTWQPVEGDASYVVRINEDDYPTENLMMDLSSLAENAAYELRVKAVFDLGDSAYTSPVNYITYFDVVATYKGTYNINLSSYPTIDLDAMYTIEHVFHDGAFLAVEDFTIREEVLFINYEVLQTFDLGDHVVKLCTPEGVVVLSLEIIEDNKPFMISSNSVPYVVGEDIELLYEVFDGTFVSMSGHDIEETDYDFDDGTLTIYASYLDPTIAAFESDTIIFSYYLKAGDHITIGYIFIRIP